MNPAQAWQSALEQLQMEMPKAAFDTWVRDTQLISCEDGVFTIAARNTYACDWLESRLTSTVTRLLMGIMNQSVTVHFVVETPEGVGDTPEEEDPDPAGKAANLFVELVGDTAYSNEVHPKSVVMLDGYLFRLLEQGDIDHNQASLYLGFHQAAWKDWKNGKGEYQNLAWRNVCSWGMMSRAVFYNEIAGLPVVRASELVSPGKGAGRSMIGLVERVEIRGRRVYRQGRRLRSIANRYRVHMEPRLTRLDALALENLIRSKLGNAQDENQARLIAILADLYSTNRITDILAGNDWAQEASPDSPAATTVMEIVRRVTGQRGELPPQVRTASEELHRKIINGFGRIFFTQYFIKTVVPALGLTRPQAWWIAWLRDQCYEDKTTGEKRDFVVIDGGFPEIARRVGVTPESIRGWMAIDEQGNPATPVSCFVARIEFEQMPSEFRQKNTLFLKVRTEEPLVSEYLEHNRNQPLRVKHGGRRSAKKCTQCKCNVFDRQEVFVLSQEARKAIGITRSSLICVGCAEAALGRELTSLDFEDVASSRSSLLARRAGSFKSSGNLDSDQNLETPETENLRHQEPRLETPGRKLETPEIKNLRLAAPKFETPFNLFKLTLNSSNSINTSSEAAPEGVVAPSCWNLTRLFNFNPVSSKLRIDLAGADPGALISWLLYAVSPTGAGIDHPWNWALAQLRDSPHTGAGGAYDRLAALAPGELLRLCRYSYERATKPGLLAVEFQSGQKGSGNALWDQTMGDRNEQAGTLIQLLFGIDPDDDLDIALD